MCGVVRVLPVAALVLAALVQPAAAAKGPAGARAWFDKGAAHHKRGEIDEAIAAYRKAYSIKPHPVHLYNLALAYRDKGDPKESVRFYRLFLSVAPESELRPKIETEIAELEAAMPPAPEPPAETTLPVDKADEPGPEETVSPTGPKDVFEITEDDLRALEVAPVEPKTAVAPSAAASVAPEPAPPAAATGAEKPGKPVKKRKWSKARRFWTHFGIVAGSLTGAWMVGAIVFVAVQSDPEASLYFEGTVVELSGGR